MGLIGRKASGNEKETGIWRGADGEQYELFRGGDGEELFGEGNFNYNYRCATWISVHTVKDAHHSYHPEHQEHRLGNTKRGAVLLDCHYVEHSR